MPTPPLKIHFAPRDGWINDPLGLTYRDGTYHLFYQYVPGSSEWALNCHWGHATGPDLFGWTEQPVALRPDETDDGCWSGCVVSPPDGDAVMFYTSVRRPDIEIGRVRRARPTRADWNAWRKEDCVVQRPADVALTAFRDPFVFRDRDRWRMLVGAGRADTTATVLVFTSADLVTWDYTGPLTARPGSDTHPVWTGTMWECPQLVSVGEQQLFIVSVHDRGTLHYVACAVGAYGDGRFEPETWYRLTYGPAPYAASF
jgi:beta-fructofuranosidase